MKRLVTTLAFLLVGSSAFAQDDLGAFGGLFGGDVGLSAPAAARGAPAPARGTAAPAPDRLVRLKDALVKASAPLTREQETALNGLLDAEVPAMRRSLQAKVTELGLRPAAPAPPAAGQPPAQSAAPAPAAQAPSPQSPAPQAAPRGAPGGLPPGGAGPRGAPPNVPNLDAKAEATIRRFILGLNDQLLRKIAAAPALKTEQQTVLQTLYKDQIRARGGLDAIQLALEDAGAPFTTEQMSQIQPLFDEQDLARAQLQRESQGQPDAAKVGQLEQATLLKVVRLLTPSQRTALQTASAKPRQ